MSFDSFHTSGNSPGRHIQPRRTILGFGFVGPAIVRTLTTGGTVPGFEFALILDRPPAFAGQPRSRELPPSLKPRKPRRTGATPDFHQGLLDIVVEIHLVAEAA